MACGVNKTLHALGIDVTCVYSTSWGHQLVQLTRMAADGTPFLALLLAPSRASMYLNVTRVELPSRTVACLAQPHSPCQFPVVTPRKVRWIP